MSRSPARAPWSTWSAVGNPLTCSSVNSLFADIRSHEATRHSAFFLLVLPFLADLGSIALAFHTVELPVACLAKKQNGESSGAIFTGGAQIKKR